MKKYLNNILGVVASLAVVACMTSFVACGNGDNKGKDEIIYTATELPAAEVSIDYTASVASATGADNIKYTMSKGVLPTGIILAADGELSGKPTKDGEFSFTVKASSGSLSATADYKLTVNKHLYDITYNGAMLNVAVVGESYEASVATATSMGKETIRYSTNDTLPAGLTLSEDGVISGTPTAATDGATIFEVTAVADDAHPATANFSLTVSATALESIVYNPTDLDDAQVDVTYNGSVATVMGIDGVKYSLYRGSELPAGLTLEENGTISGTPTGESKLYEFTVVASANGYASSTARFSLFVKPVRALAEYTFEAEYVDLTGFTGSGISGHAEGIKAIEPSPDKESNCSNGYYVGWTHAEGISITFVINSDSEATAKLSLSLATEGAPIPVKSSSMTVAVNNNEIDYDLEVYAPESNETYWLFNKYVISQSVKLKKGENKIVLTIADNGLLNGDGALGFMIDALYLETEAYLSWTPHTFDPDDI